MDYPGKVITKTQVTPTQTSASGNWTLDDQAAAIKNNNWPVALVPNPISKSLRFNSADSAYLNRTPASAGNRQTWTWSGWVKRSALGVFRVLFSNNTTDPRGLLAFSANDELRIYSYNGSTYDYQLVSSSVYRDVSAWYHVVSVSDTTQATSSNRVKLYVNGTQITAFSTATYPSQNFNGSFNAAVVHNIGREAQASSQYFSGYLTEINFVDGQALTPSDFGLTNPQTGQWIPKKYTGTYGTNGFYLNFKDATSTTTLGYDYSGNANNWTTNNFSVTAGSGNDSLTDVPTPWVAYNTTGDVGGIVRGNYATFNPLNPPAAYGANTFSNGNLQTTSTSTTSYNDSNIFVSSGKWYVEITPLSNWTSDINNYVGFVNILYCSDGNTYNGSSYSGTGTFATYTNGDIIGVAFDADAYTSTFYKNGTSQGTVTGVSPFFPIPFRVRQVVSGMSTIANFGQRPFAYTPPAGFRSLCTTNLPATTIGFGLTNQGGNYFNAVLWTGDGASSRNITGVGFQPDWVWLKSRSNATVHRIFDSVRGATKTISSNLTDAESTEAQQLTAFISDGFSLGSDVGTNGSARTFVAWNWKAAGSTVSNTSGTITSTVSANTTAGFSIVTYTGTGANATVGHGLGVTPGMIIVKDRSAANDWVVWHRSYSSTTQGYMYLNSTGAVATSSGFWNSTAPTSTLVSLGNLWTNTSGSGMVMYAFAPIAGYSAFGSYTGNGSADGVFVYLGFRPRFILIKATSAVEPWAMLDSVRDPYNLNDAQLTANSSAAETNDGNGVDFVSNGVKLRSAIGNWNSNGATYIYAAFAESPFQFSNAR